MRIVVIALLASLLLSGCFSVNSDIRVEDGQTVDGSLNTINGSVSVGSESVVDGNAKTVNGSISIGPQTAIGGIETVNGKVTLGAGAMSESIEAINGSIEIGQDAAVDGRVETVNGRVLIGKGAVIDGLVESVNGQIRLQGATVGSLKNVRGGMVLEAGSRVLGELRVVKSRGGEDSDSVLVEIYADSEVVGPLIFERPVRLRIHESAQVGEIEGAEPEYFSG